jgi:transcription elongation factor GreA
MFNNGFRRSRCLFFTATPNTMSKISYYTKDGLERLKKELSELKSKGRSSIAKQIAEARDKGDLSENAEYDAAKDAQGHLEAKIAQLEDLMGGARLLDESKIDTSSVSILSKVTIKNKKNNALVTYTLVSEEEADLKLGRISTQSPIGKGLLGKKKGESAKIKTPAGEIEFEVVDITA